MGDINQSMDKEAKKRKLSTITLSEGAVVARHGASESQLSSVRLSR